MPPKRIVAQKKMPASTQENQNKRKRSVSNSPKKKTPEKPKTLAPFNNKYIGKRCLTKNDLLTVGSQKIPKNILKQSLEAANLSDIEFDKDRNESCSAAIHLFWNGIQVGSRNQLAAHFRNCLMRRDWNSLANLLTNCDYCGTKSEFLNKYAALCLAHNDEHLFDTYLQSVLNFVDGPQAALEYCTKIPQ